MSSGQDWEVWLDRFQDRLMLEGMSQRTVCDRMWLLGKFVTWCRQAGVHGPQGATRALLEDYLRYRVGYINAKGRKDRAYTVNSHVKAVKRLGRFLIEQGVWSAGMVSALAYMRVPRNLPRVTPTHDQIMRLIRAIPTQEPAGIRDRLIIEMLYSCALRRSELAGLCLGDVSVDSACVQVRQGKGGKDRLAPMGVHAMRWLGIYIQSARPALMARWSGLDHERLFVSCRGNPLSGSMIGLIVRRWGRRAGLGLIGPHALRRACATEMIRGGANTGHVKEILGHEDFSSLTPYVRLVVEDLKKALKRYHPRERGDE